MIARVVTWRCCVVSNWPCRGLCAVLLGLLGAAFAMSGARADEATPGAIVGVVTNSAKAPIPYATVTATKLGGGGIRATVANSNGVYSLPDLPPGKWAITSKADGFAETFIGPALDVATNQATRYDVEMRGPVNLAQAATPVPATVTTAQTATVPEALQAPDPAPADDKITPWADVGYIGWMNGNTRENSPIFDTKFFTPEIRFDMNYLYSGNHPRDHTIDGSTEEFRSGEFQIEQVSFGGDFHWNGVKARFLSMLGMFSVTTPRNDASQAVGQWDLQGAYKYFSEANAGYHWDVAHGLNVDLGIFVSYIGLFSYYNFDNWTYQPSYVSSNTPWFFNGMRVQ